jgi:pimeloyl-ACP methyl ester carboxylesterase
MKKPGRRCQATSWRIFATPAATGELATWSDPSTAAAWGSIPVTLIIGRLDDLVPADRVAWAERHLDIRILDTDHFIIFREPGFVADVVIEKLDLARRSGLGAG